MADHLPLLHLLLHVDPLFVQQLPLSERPVHGLHGGLRARGPLPLHAGLLWVVEAEHVALAHDDAVPWRSPRQTCQCSKRVTLTLTRSLTLTLTLNPALILTRTLILTLTLIIHD